MKTVVSQKSHNGSICDKQFVSRNALYGRRKTKHSNTMHICKICGKSFERER